ncbi:hypothetical protein D3C80_1420200 [compost metagenome]
MQLEAGIGYVTRHAEIFHLEHSFLSGGSLAVGIEFGDISSNHQAGHIRRVQRCAIMCSNQTTVAQNRNAISNLLHLGQPVRNIEHGNALGTDVANDRKQSISLHRGEGRSRLIKNDQSVRHQQHPSNLHKLPLSN